MRRCDGRRDASPGRRSGMALLRPLQEQKRKNFNDWSFRNGSRRSLIETSGGGNQNASYDDGQDVPRG